MGKIVSSGQKLADLKAEYLRDIADEFDQRVAGWGAASPIEQLMIAQFLVSGFRFASCSDWQYEHGEVRSAVPNMTPGYQLLVGGPHHNEALWVQPTVTINGHEYRPDFAIIYFDEKLAIELDGHDFHEKTKEQARRDKARGRDFVDDGWAVIRFTGSEVFADTEGVIDAIMASLTAGCARHSQRARAMIDAVKRVTQ